MPEPEPPTTTTLWLRSVLRSNLPRSSAIRAFFVRMMLLSGAFASPNALISALVAQRALPCSSPFLVPLAVRRYDQAIHTAQTSRTPTQIPAGSPVKPPPFATKPGSVTAAVARFAIGSPGSDVRFDA